VFSDRTVSPTHVMDAAAATEALLDSGAPSGVYHCVNSGRCTWLDFGREAARLLGVEGAFEIVRMEEVVLKAARPKYCALSNAKLASLGITMPVWQEALARHLQEVRHDLAHQLSDRQR
jgi:dTDP-4-dehydrorhamnose reductase